MVGRHDGDLPSVTGKRAGLAFVILVFSGILRGTPKQHVTRTTACPLGNTTRLPSHALIFTFTTGLAAVDRLCRYSICARRADHASIPRCSRNGYHCICPSNKPWGITDFALGAGYTLSDIIQPKALTHSGRGGTRQGLLPNITIRMLPPHPCRAIHTLSLVVSSIRHVDGRSMLK